MFWDIYLIAYLLGAMLAMGMQIGEYGNENNRDFTGVGYKIFWTIVAILLSWITVGLLYQAKRK